MTVSISTLNSGDLRKKNFIGIRPQNYESDQESGSGTEDNNNIHKIPGMESDEESAPKKPKKVDEEILKIKEKIKSEKDIKRFIKQKAKQSLKKSKVIKSRDHLHKKKSLKLSHRKKQLQEKFMKKHKKIPKNKKK